MIETNSSSNAATVSIYLSRSFIVSNVRDSLVYVFGGLKNYAIRPEFFYFLVLGSADPNFWKSRIKIKLGSKSFIFILSADRLMPSTNKIKARTIF